MNLPEEIWVTDTTFRDGQQAREPYTTEQMVELYKYLHELGGKDGGHQVYRVFLYRNLPIEFQELFKSSNEAMFYLGRKLSEASYSLGRTNPRNTR